MPKILFLDLETAPNLGWVWGKWEQNVIAFEEDWYILSFAYKWQGQAKVHFKGLPDYTGYDKNKKNDKKLVQDLWKIMDEADIIVAHNGERFDIKKSNARFVYHGLTPPSPYKTVDTLKVARKIFRFDSNKLNDLGVTLGLGKKLPNTGFDLWKRCMDGVLAAWRDMKAYNVQDIVLLEKIYNRFKAWDKGHPNLKLYSRPDACPTCQSIHVQKRGLSRLQQTIKQRWTCMSCGAWWSGKFVK